MRFTTLTLLCSIILSGFSIQTSHANVNASTNPKQTTLSGTIITIVGNRLLFKTNSAANYDAETSNSLFTRRNGSNMRYEEFVVGDKIQVTGTLWPDNSINAKTIRNLSLYTHRSTFTGKVTSINPLDSSFTMESKTNGTQVVRTSSLTGFKKAVSLAAFADIELGVTVIVKAVWDRSKASVLADQVTVTSRLIKIEFTGQVVLKNINSITVVANNVVYGVDVSHSKLLSTNNKPISLHEITVGGQVKVTGKHVAESVRVTASTVKDLSTTK